MSKVIEITGKITDTDGKTTEFVITTDLGWQQWGERQEVLGSRVDLLEALAQASNEFMGAEEDEEPEQDEGITPELREALGKIVREYPR